MSVSDTVADTATKDRPGGPARRWAAFGIRSVLPYGLALYIADVFLTYLPFKFFAGTGNPIFSRLETWSGIAWIEPDFRFFTGGVEALASLLLFIPGLQVIGALLAFAVMGGAIVAHVFTPLGIDPFNDGAQLFRQAVTVWVFAALILAIRWRELVAFARLALTDRNLVRAWRQERL